MTFRPMGTTPCCFPICYRPHAAGTAQLHRAAIIRSTLELSPQVALHHPRLKEACRWLASDKQGVEQSPANCLWNERMNCVHVTSSQGFIPDGDLDCAIIKHKSDCEDMTGLIVSQAQPGRLLPGAIWPYLTAACKRTQLARKQGVGTRT
jgi:hypothetical protein